MQTYRHFHLQSHLVISQYLCKSIVILTSTPHSVVSQYLCKSTAKTAIPKSNGFFPSHYPSLNSYTRVFTNFCKSKVLHYSNLLVQTKDFNSQDFQRPSRGLSGNLHRTFHWPWECPCDSAAGWRSWGHGAVSSCHGDEPQLCTAVSSRSSPHLNNTANNNKIKIKIKLVTSITITIKLLGNQLLAASSARPCFSQCCSVLRWHDVKIQLLGNQLQLLQDPVFYKYWSSCKLT